MCIKRVDITQLLCIIIVQKEVCYPMKRSDLVKKLENGGFVFERHGGNHDIYSNGNVKETIPRHNEINERLAKAILKRNGLV